MRHEVPKSIMFADDVVLYRGNEVDMTEYLESWRQTREGRGLRVSRPTHSGWNVGSRFELAVRVDR